MLILYRFAPERRGSADRPAGFSKERAFASLRASVEASSVPVRLVAVVDGDEPAPGFLVAGVDEVVGSGRRRGSAWSFLTALELAAGADDDELVLFAEDDYLYRPEAIGRLAAAHAALGADSRDYLTPYEHPDLYRVPEQQRAPASVLALDGAHWRTCVSTCMTFAASARRLEHDAPYLRLAAGSTDTASWRLWAALVRRKRRDLVTWSVGKSTLARGDGPRSLRPVLRDAAAVVGSRGPARRLLAPVPSLAAHAMRDQLPVGCSWRDFGVDEP